MYLGLQDSLETLFAALALGVVALGALAVVCLTIVKCTGIISRTILGVTSSNTRRQISVAQAYAGKTTEASVESNLAVSDHTNVVMPQPFTAIIAATSAFGRWINTIGAPASRASRQSLKK